MEKHDTWPRSTDRSEKKAIIIVCILMTLIAIEGPIRALLPSQPLIAMSIKDAVLSGLYCYVFAAFPARRSGKFDSWLIGLIVVFASLVCVYSYNVFFVDKLTPLIGIRSYIFYLPMVVVGFRLACSSRALLILKVGSILLYMMFIVTVYQVSTGAVGYGDELAMYRNNVDGSMVMTATSTLYGGRLAPYAAFWTVISIAQLAYMAKGTSAVQKLHWILCLMMSVFMLLVGTNRTAVMAVIICCVYMGWKNKKILLPLVALSVVTVFASLLLIALGDSDFAKEYIGAQLTFVSGLTKFTPDDASDLHANRWGVAGTGLISALSEAEDEIGWFGIGNGTRAPGISRVTDAGYVHLRVDTVMDANQESGWVRLFVELGVLGIALFTAILVRMGKLSSLSFARHPDELSILGIPALVIYICLFHKHLGFGYDPMMQIYAFLLAGLSIGRARNRVREHLHFRAARPIGEVRRHSLVRCDH
ncbi:hypothetical protein [uncultured Paludibaculum sp.]|uniref:hypothetical protein n=1 Tax=uncultured Paludibaculum sp. TaxID=1765020 RepID=UPI002AAA79CB|nr:hypothetical protein [uncultured Paludibaculum sp.]